MTSLNRNCRIKVFRGTSPNWFNSCICNRTQYGTCSYKGTKSECSVVTHGVPQGSVLGALLIILYTNDLPNSIKHSKTILFADDTTIHVYMSLGTIVPIYMNKSTRTFLISLTGSEQTNSQSMPVKQNVCLYPARTIPARTKIDDENLDQVTHTKSLGLLLDQHLDRHLDHLRRLYRTMINPYLLYGKCIPEMH